MIGISTTNTTPGTDWLNLFIENGFNIIELNHAFTPIYYNDDRIENLIRAIRKNKLKLTIHSGATSLLHPDKLIAKAHLLWLKSEIKYASKLNAKYIAFHLPARLDHTKDKKKIHAFLSEVLKFAGRHGVTLCLENDAGGPWSDPERLLRYFKKFKSLGHVVDIGHLNIAIHNNSALTWPGYFNMLGKYARYVHLHNNHGKIDEHNGLGDGNIDLTAVASFIKEHKPEIIILETRNIPAALKSRKLLQKNL